MYFIISKLHHENYLISDAIFYYENFGEYYCYFQFDDDFNLIEYNISKLDSFGRKN